MSTLREVKNNEDQMSKLCSSFLGHLGQSKSTLSAVERAIKERITEFKYFTKDRDQLLYLCNSIASDIEHQKDFEINGEVFFLLLLLLFPLLYAAW